MNNPYVVAILLFELIITIAIVGGVARAVSAKSGSPK